MIAHGFQNNFRFSLLVITYKTLHAYVEEPLQSCTNITFTINTFITSLVN